MPHQAKLTLRLVTFSYTDMFIIVLLELILSNSFFLYLFKQTPSIA